jgi:hypothetical protein
LSSVDLVLGIARKGQPLMSGGGPDLAVEVRGVQEVSLDGLVDTSQVGAGERLVQEAGR